MLQQELGHVPLRVAAVLTKLLSTHCVYCTSARAEWESVAVGEAKGKVQVLLLSVRMSEAGTAWHVPEANSGTTLHLLLYDLSARAESITSGLTMILANGELQKKKNSIDFESRENRTIMKTCVGTN